jgi:hypothetical protein
MSAHLMVKAKPFLQAIDFPPDITDTELMLLKEEHIIQFELDKIKETYKNKRSLRLMGRFRKNQLGERFTLYSKKAKIIDEIKVRYSISIL